MVQKTGILLINLGTPDAPTEQSLKSFLAEFLSDPYVVDYPRWLWMPILEHIILRVRPKKSARLYKAIWQETGSPLLTITRSIAAKLKLKLPDNHVTIAMRYGNPSTLEGLNEMKEQDVTDLIIFPLFPQYSSTTTQTALEQINRQTESQNEFQNVTAIQQYHDHPAYICSLAESVQQAWAKKGKPEKTIFSFHGIPKRYISKNGESYQDQCYSSANLTIEKLGLRPSEVAISFQSRFGPEPWLSPYTNEKLAACGAEGCKSLQVICPGFSADCLETLEEIAIQGKNVYTRAGGEKFHYIPALNDSESHIDTLVEIISVAMTSANREG